MEQLKIVGLLIWLAVEVPAKDASNEWCEAVSEEDYMNL